MGRLRGGRLCRARWPTLGMEVRRVWEGRVRGRSERAAGDDLPGDAEALARRGGVPRRFASPLLCSQ